MYIQPFTTVVDWPEIGCLMEVSTMFCICRYCVFTWDGRLVYVYTFIMKPATVLQWYLILSYKQHHKTDTIIFVSQSGRKARSSKPLNAATQLDQATCQLMKQLDPAISRKACLIQASLPQLFGLCWMISCCRISFMFNQAINEWKLNIRRFPRKTADWNDP